MTHPASLLSAYIELVACGALLGMVTVTHPLNRHFRVTAVTLAGVLLVSAIILLVIGANL